MKNLSALKLVAILTFAYFGQRSAAAQSFDQCIYALNPSAAGAVTMNGAVDITAPNCGVVVNSSSAQALQVTGSSHLTAKYTKVAGGASITGASAVSPSPQTGAPVQPDPLAFLVPPTAGAVCDHTNYAITSSGNFTLYPGTYCGGLNIGGSVQVIMSPGVYIMKGGGFTAGGSAQVAGVGVTIFLTQASGYTYGPVNINGAARLNLSAPSEGSLYGVLFYQDPAIGSGKPGNTFAGSTQSTLSGVLYFPNTTATFSGTASGSQGQYLIIVADRVIFNGSASINANYPPNGSPLVPPGSGNPVSVSLTPLSVSVVSGFSQQFNATVTNASNPAVSWTITPAGRGAITIGGLYTAPAGVVTQETITIRATSVQDSTKFASSTVTLLPPSAQNFDQCIYALNPTAGSALSLSGAVNVNAPNCGVVVNSSSSTALSISGSSHLTAKYNKVKGSISITGSSTAVPAPVTSSPVQADPLGFLVPPTSTGSCTSTNISLTSSGSFNLSPGIYCNGINIGGNVSVTFSPGTYILRGGGLKIDGSSTVTGSGVTFFFTQATGNPYGPLAIGGAATVNLSAPESGSYYGILFYQDPSIGTGKPASTFAGSAQSTIAGVLYFPTTALSYSGATSTSPGAYQILIADTISYSGSSTSTINNNYPAGGSPLNPGGAAPQVSVTVNPGATSINAGLTRQFNAIVANAANANVTWSASPSGVGSINATGLYTSPATVSQPTTVTITATSVQDPTKSGTATLTVLQAVTVSVDISAKTLYGGQSQQFAATVGFSPGTGVTWEIAPSTGTITAGGLYAAPATVAGQSTVTVTARSQTDPSRFATATITLMPPLAISVEPGTVTLFAGQAQTFEKFVTNAPDDSVTWSVVSPGVGTITAGGVYTAPSPVVTAQTVTIRATSVFDTSKSATATVSLIPLTISVAPPSSTLSSGQTQQFTVTVQYASSSTVNWTISPANAGSISSGGLYSAPALVSTAQTVTITATSAVDSSKTATATVSLTPVEVISITPQTITLSESQMQQFAAAVQNSTNTSVTWSVTPGLGTISTGGLYTAPSCITGIQTVVVTATSVADTTKSISATVTLAASHGYSFVRPVRIDRTKVAGALTDFPFLFTGTYSFLASTSNGGKVQSAAGDDIFFASDLAGTALKYEIESYDPTTGRITAWIRIPVLSNTADTVIYLLYGKAGVTSSPQDKTAVWGTSAQSVWHLANAALTADSSTGNAVLTNNGATTTIDGKIGAAANLSGVGQYLNAGDRGQRPTNGTVSLWARFTLVDRAMTLFSGRGRNSDACQSLRFEVYPDGSMRGNHGTALGCYSRLFTLSISSGVWHHFVMTWTSPDRMRLYVDGKLTDDAIFDGIIYGNAYDNVTLGAGFNTINDFQGQMDEVRLASVARSGAWITTEFNNQNSPESFYGIAGENSVTISVEPSVSGLYGGQSQQFSSIALGACSAVPVTWTVTGAGSVSSTGVYSAPATISTQQSITVKATSQSDSTKFGSATITLLPPASVSVSPGNVTLYNGQSRQLSAVLSNAVNTAVTWTLSPSVGSIDASGNYTAPATITSQQNISVIATSVADPSKFSSAMITLIPGQGVSTTGDAFSSAFDLISQILCRRPHLAPAVSTGPTQIVSACPTGGCSLPFKVFGLVSDYSLNPGQNLTYTWSLISGPASVTFSPALSPQDFTTVEPSNKTVTVTKPGSYLFQFSVNDGIATSSAQTTVIVNPTNTAGGNSLYITPTNSGPNPTGSVVPIQIKYLRFNSPVADSIHVVITGANPRTFDAVTDSNGDYTYSFLGSNPGTDFVTASHGGDIANTAEVVWQAPTAQLSSSAVTGRFFTNDGSGAFNTPANQNPLFTQSFPGINFNPPAGSIPGNTSGGTELTRPFTAVVTDKTGAYLGTIPAQGSDYQAGTGTLFNFNAVFTGAFSVPSAGPVTFTITSDDAFIFGVGGGASRVSGPTTSTPGTTPFSVYPVMGGVNIRSAPSPQQIVVNFPAAGTYPYEVDYAKAGDAKLTLNMLVGGLPIPSATLLTLTPGTVPTTQSGFVRDFVITATDAAGIVLSNVPVTVNIKGVNQQSRILTTDGAGRIGFSYAGSPTGGGRDEVQATANFSGVIAASNIVPVNWYNAPNAAPAVVAGSNQSVILPSEAILNGYVSDDGLPNGTTTITWSKVSGPGTVIFGNPAQAVTSASFSDSGAYVLQLAANDGTLSATSTVNVNVVANSSWSTGWLAAPLDRATITSPVPVTLTAGVTLTSGTLKIWPSNNSTQVTTLNANTTGSGSIATLDPTLLENGNYFVELRATDSNNVTQPNTILVTIAGDFKPGRVTATVTDLVVPAPGLPIQIQRTYDSLNRANTYDFGQGWNLGVSVQMQVSPVGDVTFTLNGRRRTFYFTPPANSLFTYWYTPLYTPEPGLYGSLVNLGDNCGGVMVRTGSIWTCAINNAGSQYAPLGYRYTDPYGRVYTMGPNGAIQAIQDLNGNTITITAGGISSSSGFSVPFVRDTAGRITRITDTRGNYYDYAYDAAGDLKTVKYPDIAIAAEYSYDATHLLTQEKDHRGNVAGTTEYYTDGKLKKITDAVGNATQYAYDIPSRTTTVTNPDGGTVITVADGYGKPITITDPIGRVTSGLYDAKHNLISETNGAGETTQHGYDANGFHDRVTDALGHSWGAVYNIVGGPASVSNPIPGQTQSVTYDANFRISTITDPLGSIAQFTYNAAGLPLTLKDARNNTSSYTYNAQGQRLTYTDPLLRVTTSTYDNQGNLVTERNARNITTTYGYDAFNRRTSMTAATGLPEQAVTTYEYDGNGNKTKETNPRGFAASFTYDAENRVTRIDYPDLTHTEMTYDWRGNKLTEVGQRGHTTKFVYDLAGQLTSSTAAFSTPDAATTSHTYDGAGRKKTDVDPRGNTTQYQYDIAGRMTKVIDPVGNVVEYGYNDKGERTSVKDAKLRTTLYSYDFRGRQLETTTPDAQVVKKTYDGLGLLRTVEDEQHRITEYRYDEASQLKKVIDALNQMTDYEYDAAGNLTTQKDARSSTTTYQYDALNRRIRRTLPLGQFEQYTYDAAGNRASRVDFNGKTTTYSYDQLNRLLSRTPDVSFNVSPIVFTYTGTSQRLSMTDPSGTTNYTYTARDQVLSKATPQGTLTYTYDLSGNVASANSSNTNGTSVNYVWDANGRLASVTDNRTGGTTNYNYDATNQVASFTYPNGVTHTYGYNDRNWTTSLSVTRSSTALATYTQTYSDSGRKQSVSEANGRTVNYSYDPIYRLLGETISGDPTTANNGALNYGLDQVGNRLSLASTLAALQSQNSTYDPNDRINGDTFDNNGNTTSSSGVSYTFDFEDRLVSAGVGISMTYDGDGSRVAKTEAGVTTRYLIDSLTPAGDSQVAEEVSGGAVGAQYSYGIVRISQNRAGTVSYYGYDAGSSVRQLSNAAGVVTDQYTYDGFGNTTWQTGTTANTYLYRAEHFEPALGFYYLRARWYQPKTGRFVTADTFEGDVETPASLHDYVYAQANPVSGVDPTGFATAIENAHLSSLTIRIRALTTFVRTGGVTLGQVEKGAEIAYNAVCCLDKAWSVLSLAMEVSGNPAAPALALIDKACKLQCSSKRDKGKTFIVYKKMGPDGKTYIGRASGYGSPASIGRGRDSGHHMNAQGYGPAVPIAVTDNYFTARGLEQLAIESLGGVGSDALGNAINGIRTGNPLADKFLQCGLKALTEGAANFRP